MRATQGVVLYEPVASGEEIGWIWKYSYANKVDFVWFYELLKCESGFNEFAVGDLGKAFGIAQYHKGTFNDFCEGEYKNPEDQIKCMAEMLGKKLEYHWANCVAKVANN